MLGLSVFFSVGMKRHSDRENMSGERVRDLCTVHTFNAFVLAAVLVLVPLQNMSIERTPSQFKMRAQQRKNIHTNTKDACNSRMCSISVLRVCWLPID